MSGLVDGPTLATMGALAFLALGAITLWALGRFREWWAFLALAVAVVLFSYFYVEPLRGATATISKVRADGERVRVYEEGGATPLGDPPWHRRDLLDGATGALLGREVVGRYGDPEPPSAGDDFTAALAPLLVFKGENQRISSGGHTLAVVNGTLPVSGGALHRARFLCARCYGKYIHTIGVSDPPSVIMIHDEGQLPSLARVSFDGRLLWSVSFDQLGGAILQSHDDELFCVSRGALVFPLAGAQVIALDPETGHVSWRARL